MHYLFGPFLLWAMSVGLLTSASIFKGFEDVGAQVIEMAWWFILLSLFTITGLLRWRRHIEAVRSIKINLGKRRLVVMNDFLRVALALCVTGWVIAANAWLLHQAFELDLAYLLDTLLSEFGAVSLTILEVFAFRMAAGKLKVRIVWG
jgi:hypothetical protein